MDCIPEKCFTGNKALLISMRFNWRDESGQSETLTWYSSTPCPPWHWYTQFQSIMAGNMQQELLMRSSCRRSQCKTLTHATNRRMWSCIQRYLIPYCWTVMRSSSQNGGMALRVFWILFLLLDVRNILPRFPSSSLCYYLSSIWPFSLSKPHMALEGIPSPGFWHRSDSNLTWMKGNFYACGVFMPK